MLGESLVPTDLYIADGSAGHLHSLLEVTLGKLGDGVLRIFIDIHVTSALGLTGTLSLNVNSDGLLDGNLDCTLGDESKIGTGEAVRLGCNVVQVDVTRNRRLP